MYCIKTPKLSSLVTMGPLLLMGCGGMEAPEAQPLDAPSEVKQAIGTSTLYCGYYPAPNDQAFCVGSTTSSWPPETPYWNYQTPGGWWSGWYSSGWEVNWYNCLRPYGTASRTMGVQFKTGDGYTYSNVSTWNVNCR